MPPQHKFKIGKPFGNVDINGDLVINPESFSTPEFAMLRYLQMGIFETIPGIQVKVTSYPEYAVVTVLTKNIVETKPVTNFITSILNKQKLIKLRSNLFKSNSVIELYGVVFGGNFTDGGYSDTERLAIYDIVINSKILPLNTMSAYLKLYSLDMVPIIYRGSIEDGAKLCIHPPKSIFGDFDIAGIVMRPEIDIYTRSGERIIAELSVEDFKHEVPRQKMQTLISNLPTVTLAIGNPPTKVGELTFIKNDATDEYTLDFKGSTTPSAQVLFDTVCQMFQDSHLSKVSAVKANQILGSWIAGPTPQFARTEGWLAGLILVMARCIHGTEYKEWSAGIKNWDLLVEKATKGVTRQNGKPELSVVK